MEDVKSGVGHFVLVALIGTMLATLVIWLIIYLVLFFERKPRARKATARSVEVKQFKPGSKSTPWNRSPTYALFMFIGDYWAMHGGGMLAFWLFAGPWGKQLWRLWLPFALVLFILLLPYTVYACFVLGRLWKSRN